MISYYEAPYTQRGNGFGGIFRGLSRFISPIASTIKKVVSSPTVKNLAKDALKAGVSLGADALEGRNVKEGAKEALAKGRKRVAETMRTFARGESDVDESESDSEEERVIKRRKKKKKKTNVDYRRNSKKPRTIFDN